LFRHPLHINRRNAYQQLIGELGGGERGEIDEEVLPLSFLIFFKLWPCGNGGGEKKKKSERGVSVLLADKEFRRGGGGGSKSIASSRASRRRKGGKKRKGKSTKKLK